MDTNVLCAECFKLMTENTGAASLMLSDAAQTAVLDREYCEECGAKLAELLADITENEQDNRAYEKCAVCKGTVGEKSGYLRAQSGEQEIKLCICQSCVAALSKNISSLLERKA